MQSLIYFLTETKVAYSYSKHQFKCLQDIPCMKFLKLLFRCFENYAHLDYTMVSIATNLGVPR